MDFYETKKVTRQLTSDKQYNHIVGYTRQLAGLALKRLSPSSFAPPPFDGFAFIEIVLNLCGIFLVVNITYYMVRWGLL